jgi:hypothetical protein
MRKRDNTICKIESLARPREWQERWNLVDIGRFIDFLFPQGLLLWFAVMVWGWNEKIRMAATRRNLFPRSKKNSSWTNSFSDPKGEVSNLIGSFKNPPDKILIWTAMNSRQTAEWLTFFFRKNLFFSDKKF